ncbi:hypothetical protein D9M69_630880 [compost metagenome]
MASTLGTWSPRDCGPKPQRLSSGSTVMSKAPPLSFDSSPAKVTSSSMGAGSAMQLPAGKALKRSTSESAR